MISFKLSTLWRPYFLHLVKRSALWQSFSNSVPYLTNHLKVWRSINSHIGRMHRSAEVSVAGITRTVTLFVRSSPISSTATDSGTWWRSENVIQVCIDLFAVAKSSNRSLFKLSVAHLTWRTPSRRNEKRRCLSLRLFSLKYLSRPPSYALFEYTVIEYMCLCLNALFFLFFYWILHYHVPLVYSERVYRRRLSVRSHMYYKRFIKTALIKILLRSSTCMRRLSMW